MNRAVPVVALFCVLSLGACSGGTAKGPKPDQPYGDAMETGQSVLDLGHPEQAEAQYRNALTRATLRDDVTAIHDAGFNLATALLAEDKPQKALESLSQTEALLSLHGYSAIEDLSVVRAAALYRLHDLIFAAEAANRAQHAADPDIRERALFLSGLIAADRQQVQILAADVQALTAFKGTTATIDARELAARLALLRGDATSSGAEALSVVQARRNVLDYRGMRRALLLAAAAADARGDGSAASVLRARETASLKAGEDVQSVTVTATASTSVHVQ